jgi:methylmalonyl-CoA epimerase
MIRVKRIDHVALAVPDRDAAIGQLLSLFDLSATDRERVPSQNVDVAFLTPGATAATNAPTTGELAGTPASGGAPTALEVLASAGNAAIDRFIAKRGAALHHVCFEVEDLPFALATLKAAGVPLVDTEPRAGARGHDVAFIHPSAAGGILFELCAVKREST